MICLSFDIEEFDLPLEHGASLPLDRQIEISRYGTEKILDVLLRHGVKATFFVTVNFARHAPDLLARIVAAGHEVASHGMYHSEFKTEHLRQSRLELEQLCGTSVRGYRMARMMPLDASAFREAGYSYDSSLHPTFIPGRYNNLGKPRLPFAENGYVQCPASVTPILRFPLFWLSGHLLPDGLYKRLAAYTARHDGGQLTVYFHPWEFYPLRQLDKSLKIPAMIRRKAGLGMERLLEATITHLVNKGHKFGTISENLSQLRCC